MRRGDKETQRLIGMLHSMFHTKNFQKKKKKRIDSMFV